MIKSVFVCYCDWCGEEIKAGRKSLDVDGDITFQHDVCPKCFNRLKLIMNWKKNKDKKVSLNFNNSIEITLGKDGAKAWNNRYANINQFDNYSSGDIVSDQLWAICQALTPAFEKIIGSYQEVASPFEIRIPIDNLKLTKEENNENSNN